MPRAIAAFAVITLLLSACANPMVAPPVSSAERALGCEQINEEIAEAERLRIAARHDDKFMWRYIFVANAFVSAWRMNKAEMAADQRLAELRQVAAEKGC